MTTDAYPGQPIYTVAGTGPYAINHEYNIEAIAPYVLLQDGTSVLLTVTTDYTVDPAAGESGNLWLTSAAATTYAGLQLTIARATAVEQAFSAETRRESGVEASLDRITRGLQDVWVYAVWVYNTLAASISALGVQVADAAAVADNALTVALQAYGSMTGVAEIRQFQTIDALELDAVLSYSGGSAVIAGEQIHVLAGPWSYTVADAGATDHHLTTAGGVKLYCNRPDGGFCLTQWNVKPDDVASTARAQAAIDALLETSEQFVRLPAGNFIFTQLRLYNSSGSTRAQKGKFRLIGAGNLAFSDAYLGEAEGDFYGTRITIQGAFPIDDGIILADGSGQQRNTGLENLTVIYGGEGYAIRSVYAPFVDLRDVTVRITAAEGNGIQLEDCWGGVLDRVFLATDSAIVPLGHGLNFSETVFAGSFKIRDAIIDNWNTCVLIDGAGQFTNLLFENVWLQKFETFGLRCLAPIWNMVLRDVYMESDRTPSVYIKLDGASVIRNFEIDGGFLLGGDTVTAWPVGPLIEFNNVNQARLARLVVMRPWTPVAHLYSACDLTIDGLDVYHDATANLPTGPLYLFTASDGFYPKIEMNRAQKTTTSKMEWTDTEQIALSSLDGNSAKLRNQISRGLKMITIAQAAAYTWATEKVRPNSIWVTAIEGTPGAFDVAARLLPANTLEPGTELVVFNSAGSTQDCLIRNGQGSTNIATVQPGQVAHCYAEPGTDQWIVTVSTFSIGGV